MIVTTKTHGCPKCGSIEIVKNGHDKKGKQKYYCPDCGAWGTLAPSVPYTAARKEEILRIYQERASMRGVTRAIGVARQTLAHWLREKAARLPDLSQTLAAAKTEDILELDELWSFVASKLAKRSIWIALCRRTRQGVAFFIGDRSEASCRQLWRRIPETYRTYHSYSDFWEAYQTVFAEETHQSVGKESGQTNHLERWHNTLRQRLARFVRKTLSFSKSDFYHEIVLTIFIHTYNLDCIS